METFKMCIMAIRGQEEDTKSKVIAVACSGSLMGKRFIEEYLRMWVYIL